MGKRFTIFLMGGIGNQMFQIAAAYAHCRRYRYTLQIAKLLLPVLPQRPVYWDSFLNKCCAYLVEPYSCIAWREPHFHHAPIPKEVDDMVGYFQSRKYFAGFECEIRNLFSPPLWICQKVTDKYSEIDTLSSIAVHVRRGDYLEEQHVSVHATTTPDYYSRAVGYFREKYPESRIVVFSDDIEWCRQQDFFHDANFIDEKDECLALELLSRFRRYVISNSTFSWWGVFLGRQAETVIAPSKWFGPNGPPDFYDIYEGEWILFDV